MCFVHGLGAKSLDNWKKGAHVWIRDDLPNHIPSARIMTFGYDADVIGNDATFGRIRDFAKQLLEAVKEKRGQVGGTNGK